MFKFQYVAALAAFSFAGIIAQADPIDPVMSMDDPNAGVNVGLGFLFSANTNGGGYLSFTNTSGILWTTFDVYVTLPVNTPITCSGGPFFDSCTAVPTPQGGGIARYDVEFRNISTVGFQPDQLTGVSPDAFFVINLNDPINGIQPTDPNGSGGWGSGTSFTAVANGAPEPASWLLLAGGSLVVLGIRRYRRR